MAIMRALGSVLVALFCACVVVTALEVMLPMRDGTKLHTLVDFPLFTKDVNFTVVMDRSPYGADAIERIADIYTLLGFAAVRQDMRGTKQSEGNFTIWHNSGNDSYDTMKWVSEQSWSNGKIFTVGASADGIGSLFATEDHPPWLKAQMVIFATGRARPMVYPGGAFRKGLVEGWLHGTVPSQADYLINEVKQHEAPGQWWTPVNDSGRWGNVDFPSVFWGGWYDIFLQGNLQTWSGYQTQASSGWKGKSYIVVDPLGHCQSGSKYFPHNTIEGRILLPLFMSFDLYQGKPMAEDVKFVTFYVMGATDDGAPGNYWVTLDDFPAYTPRSFFLQDGGVLSEEPPTSNVANTTYAYDPSNPAPTIGGNNLELKCGPLDQRPKESRADVLTFTTEALKETLPVTGALTVELFVSTSGNDTDFTAQLTDVYPTGESRLIQDGIIRLRWRFGDENDTPTGVKPGEIVAVNISLWDTSYVWSAGHKLRVAISSSNYPRFDANPNNGLPLTMNGTAKIAQNTVYHNKVYASRVILPGVSMDQLPEAHLLLDKRRQLRRHLNTEEEVERGVELLDRLISSQDLWRK